MSAKTFTKLTTSYDKFNKPTGETLRKVDTCDAVTRSLRHRLQLQSSEEELPQNDEDKGSVRSKASFKSGITRSLNASSFLCLKRADAAAELAAKQVELEALQAEAKHKEETAKIEGELARRKAQLEQLELKKQIQIASAKLTAYKEIEELHKANNSEEFVDKDDLVRTRTSTRAISFPGPAQSSLQPPSSSPLPPPNQQAQGANNHQSSRHKPRLDNHFPHYQFRKQYINHTAGPIPRADGAMASAAATAAAITDSFSMSCLPVPEPTTFSGEPIQYSDWRSSFHASKWPTPKRQDVLFEEICKRIC